MKLKTYCNSTVFDATKDMISSIDFRDFSIEHIVIVPDRFSLQMEKLLLQTLKKSLFNVKVMGLTSLATEIFSRLHKKVEVLSSAESLLLTQKAIENVKGEFKTFRKSGINFCYEINKLLSQLKSCEVMPEDLNENAEGLSGAKYHDIMLIYREYQNLLEGKLDANGRLSLLTSEIKKSNILSKTKFYFAQFDSFTVEGYSLIKTLVECSMEVNVSLTSSLGIGNDYIYEKDILEKLTQISKECGIEIESNITNSNFSKTKEAIIRGEYSYQPVTAENNGFYSVISAQNIHEEVEGLAKIIYYLTYKGYHYCDIVVATSDLSRYQDKIEKEFDKYNIPCFVDSSVTADRTMLARVVLNFFEVISHGYQSEQLQNLFSNILIDQRELIEVIQKFNINNKYKYKKYISKSFEYDDILTKIESCTTAADYQNVVNEIIDKLQNRFDEVMARVDEKGYLKEGDIDRQSKEILQEAVGLISKYNSSEIKLAEYFKMLRLLLSFKEVSTVPTYLDGVMVGDATNSYFGDCKVLILLGCQALPQVSGDNGLLNDYDLSLNYFNKKIEPTIRMINRRNRFKVFNLLSLPSERLICFSRSFDDEGKKTEPPAFIDSLNKIFGQSIVRAQDLFLPNEVAQGNSFLIKLGNQTNFIEENLHSLSHETIEKLNLDSNLPFKNITINKDKIEKGYDLYFNNNKSVYVTQLEQYFSCPFKHFVTYGLRLKEKDSCDFDARDTGNICHAGAEIFVKYLMEQGFEGTGDVDIDKFIEDNFDFIIKQENITEKLENATERKSLIDFFKHQLHIIFADIIKELQVSSFRPKYLEKRLDSIELGGATKVKMSGKADRIDESGQYFRIIDYKTGHTGNLVKELYYGEKLQLFLYQRIVKKMLDKTPAGVFYFNAKYSYEKNDNDKLLLKGLAEDDEDILSRLDNNVGSKSDGVLSLYLNKDGQYKGSVVAKEPLAFYEDYAYKIASKAVDEIISGYIQPKPHKDSCKYCKYRGICGYEEVKGYRKLKKVDSLKGIEKDE